ncbi:MAG: helix-turn-helix domain-containing protein [Selenomonadaceae bacterium]
MAGFLTNYNDTKSQELFARRLNHLLHTRQKTRREVAAFVGVQESTVGRWALKKGMPRYIEQIEKLAEYFNVSKSYFLEENYGNTGVSQMLVAATFRERSLLMAYRAAPEEGKQKIEEVASQYIIPG